MSLSYSLHIAYGMPVAFDVEPDDPYSFSDEHCELLDHGCYSTGENRGWILVVKSTVIDMCEDSKHPDARLVQIPHWLTMAGVVFETARRHGLKEAGDLSWYAIGGCS